MKNLLFLCISAVFLLIACEKGSKDNRILGDALVEKQFETIEKLAWLVGDWTHSTEKEHFYENWTQANDSTLKAHSFILVETDTVFEERVTLQQNNNDVFFTVIAYNQNDDTPVTFKMIPSDKGTFIFENLQHDFPSRISYANPVKDSIHAWIEGTVDGEYQKVAFYYKRN
ncbi:DUF6265 family protein [Rasiella sp. SM2506]|uniref:DUF6265 family protein n=1 Tax=Rasiella sp. SM2506 TaxID=3423914 RepID=UPI003D7BFEC1